jgi:putative transposase
LVVKYRRKVINDTIVNREYIAPKYNISFLEYNHNKDHTHILFKAHPNTEISKYINAFKSASSRLIKKEFPEAESSYGKNIFGRKVFVF